MKYVTSVVLAGILALVIVLFAKEAPLDCDQFGLLFETGVVVSDSESRVIIGSDGSPEGGCVVWGHWDGDLDSWIDTYLVDHPEHRVTFAPYGLLDSDAVHLEEVVYNDT